MDEFTPAPHYRGPLVRSAVAIIPFALIAVIAVSVPRMQCVLNADAAPDCAAPATARTPTPPAVPVQATAETSPAGKAAVTGRGAPEPEAAAPAVVASATDRFDATFDSVPALPGAPAAPAPQAPMHTAALPDDRPGAAAAAGAADQAATEPDPDAIPIRVVTTVPIRLGYAPEHPAGARAAPLSAAEAARQAGGATSSASLTPGAAPAGEAEWVRVGAHYLNVRAEPSVASTRLFVLEPGQRLEVRGHDGGWVEIADARDRVGWVNADYLADANATPDATASAKTATGADATAMIVGGAGVNVRSDPSMRGDKLFALPAGARVTVSETRRGWLHITDSEGRTGWSYSTYLYEAGDG